jgi:hypothetical protein
MSFNVVILNPKSEIYLAGVGGFEPPNAGSKDPWLTACRHPNVLAVITLVNLIDTVIGRGGDTEISLFQRYSPFFPSLHLPVSGSPRLSC